MDIIDLKKRLVKKIIVFASIIVISGVSIFLLFHFKEKFSVEERTVESAIKKLKNDKNTLKKSLEQFEGQLKIWQSMTETERKLNGLRISDAKTKLNELTSRYSLFEVNISFSTPEAIQENFDIENITVNTSTMTISFNAFSDLYALQFIESLTNEFPGYIQIRSLAVSRSSDIDKEKIANIANGNDIEIVRGSVELIWNDLKYMGPEIADEVILATDESPDEEVQ